MDSDVKCKGVGVFGYFGVAMVCVFYILMDVGRTIRCYSTI